MTKVITKIKNNIHDWGATIAGIVTGGISALVWIDWNTFDVERDWKKLLISFAIGAGGYFSKFKKKEDDSK